MGLEVYGIPTCGTCKKATAWLEQNGVEYTFINTKETPPTREMLTEWVAALGAKPMRNTSGQSYRAIAAAEKQAWDDDAWIDAFALDAMIIKRPLFVKAGVAVMVGFRAPEAQLQATLNA
jgi:arsenate reductase